MAEFIRRPGGTGRRRYCLGCGRRMGDGGWWSYCWECWQVKRAAARSWHWQLERVLEELRRLDELRR